MTQPSQVMLDEDLVAVTVELYLCGTLTRDQAIRALMGLGMTDLEARRELGPREGE